MYNAIEKKLAEKCKINPMNFMLGFSLILGVALAVLLFVFTPNALAGLICKIPAIAEHPLQSLWYSLIEGGIMLAVFVIYILFCTIMKDVRRVFMYHGAEHKSIACFEAGEFEVKLTMIPELVASSVNVVRNLGKAALRLFRGKSRFLRGIYGF